MEEIWLDIKDFKGIYQVSNLGRVKSLARDIICRGRLLHFKEVILKSAIGRDGYKRVALSKDGKQKMFLVHRLVADAFIPNPNNYPIINHKDEDKANNVPENLEWCTHKYNNNYGTTQQRHAQKLKKSILQIEAKTNEIIREWSSAMDVEREIGYDQANISKCCLGQRKTANGFKWRYKE